MALIRIGFHSTALGMDTACDVVLPQLPDPDQPARRFPVMLLLHNLTKSHSTWQRMTGIERYAATRGVAVIMPDALLSSYADMIHGGSYFTYIADELLPVMRRFFPLSEKREETMICGASMGGYGALKIGIHRPDTFGVVGSLSSGFTSITTYIGRPDDRGISLEYLTFEQDGLARENADTKRRILSLASSDGPRPRIFMCIGSEDKILLDNTRESRDFFQSIPDHPFDFTYAEYPGGHNWTFWDGHICDFLAFAGYGAHIGTY
ncbi:MAG: hypothetical protein IJ074_11660 [Clostridia bacterium]|nr:hypothetical protein [Clostridia bacterium]